MAAEAEKQVSALQQAVVQVEPGNAPGRPFADAVLDADKRRGPVELLDDARGHDSDHSGMPVPGGKNESTCPGRVLLEAELPRLLLDALFDILALPVHPVQRFGQFPRLVPGRRGQEPECHVRPLQPAARVYAGSQRKPHGPGADLLPVQPRHLLQGRDARPQGPVLPRQQLQPVPDEHPVLAHDPAHVGNGAQGHEVQVGPHPCIAGIEPEQRLRQLESDADSRQSRHLVSDLGRYLGQQQPGMKD